MPEVAASRSVELTVLARVVARVDHMLSSAVVAVALLLGTVVEPNVVDNTWIVENDCVSHTVQSEWAFDGGTERKGRETKGSNNSIRS